MGPAMQSAGFLWQGIHFYVVHHHAAFSVRHLIFEPGSLLVLVGFAVGLVCVPLALEVAGASEKDLTLPEFGVGPEADALPGNPGNAELSPFNH
jgi:hypothetical protein